MKKTSPTLILLFLSSTSIHKRLLLILSIFWITKSDRLLTGPSLVSPRIGVISLLKRRVSKREKSILNIIPLLPPQIKEKWMKTPFKTPILLSFVLKLKSRTLTLVVFKISKKYIPPKRKNSDLGLKMNASTLLLRSLLKVATNVLSSTLRENLKNTFSTHLVPT